MTALPPGTRVEETTWGEVRAGDWVSVGDKGSFSCVTEIQPAKVQGSVQIETFEWLLRRGPDEPAHRLVAEDPESLRKRIALLESTCETLRDEMKRATAAIDAVVERGLR